MADKGLPLPKELKGIEAYVYDMTPTPIITHDWNGTIGRDIAELEITVKNLGSQSADDVYIVAGGCIRLFQVSSTGKETILWLGFPGEIFGMAELCRGSERQIHAVANEATQIYSISRKDFANFLGSHPEAAMKAIGILSARVRALGHALVGLASDNVETRIARLLVRFAAVSSGARCCTASTGDELCVNVRLTHQDIANLIGASRQTVSSTMAHLRKVGAVRTVNQHIHIVRPDHMRHLLGLGAA